MKARTKILVVDDQIGGNDTPHRRAFLRAYAKLSCDFLFESCEVDGKFDVHRVVEALRLAPDTDLVLMDLKFGRDDQPLGYEILRLIAEQFPSVPVLVMSSASRDIESLGQCLEEGAVGFIPKDLSPDALKQAAERAVAISRSHVLLGRSLALRELRRQAARLSPYDGIPVLIVGERGTGKERVARHIHHNGPRGDGPFVPVNCAGLAESLLEAELFGAEKGSYTGASATRIGYLERANGGVLFLDEVGNMPMATQAKLLRALQDKAFRRVGVTEEEISSDFQIIAASNVDPTQLIEAGLLREDFYDRIAAVTVRTPALRDCREDIPELANHFLRELGVEGKKRFSAEVLRVFNAYRWPGNVRELRRAVQQSVVLSESAQSIVLHHLPEKLQQSTGARTTPSTVGQGKATDFQNSDPGLWPRERILGELRLCIEAKRRIQGYKGTQWKAEFMRLMYPDCRAQNAKGFADLIRRLTKGPWGMPKWAADTTIAGLIAELQN